MIEVTHSPILTAIFRHAVATPDKTVIVTTDGREISCSELQCNILRGAEWLSHRGISRGDRVMISADKELKFIYLYLAVHLIGAVNVVVETGSNLQRLQYIADVFKPAIAIGFEIGGIPSTGYREINLAGSGRAGINIPENQPEGGSRLTVDDTADIMFTSGTTGNPKGVVLSHGNIAGAAENINAFIGNTAEDVELLALPLGQSFGLGRLRCCLLAGSMVILHNGFANLKSVFSTFEKYAVTGFGMVPSVWGYIKRLSGTRIARYASQIRYIEIGSAVLPTEDKKILSQLFPCTRICMHYGLTEASRAAFIEFHKDWAHIESVGKRVGERVDIRIFGPDGKEEAAGETGEICIKGDIVTAGYLDSGQTEEAFYNGYFRTGDLGYMDEEGYLYLTDRIKEIINVGGYKVSPVEIEEVVEKISGAESVCMAAKDPDGILGEVPRLLILKDTLNMDIEELRKRLKDRIEAYKYPRYFEIVDSLPFTANGKKKRRMEP